MCQQKTKGWLIGAWDGKVKIKLGSSVFYSGQFYPSYKLLCDYVKRGEGLNKASICNGTFVLEFEHFLKSVVGQPKCNTTIFFNCKYFEDFPLLLFYPIGPLGQKR